MDLTRCEQSHHWFPSQTSNAPTYPVTQIYPYCASAPILCISAIKKQQVGWALLPCQGAGGHLPGIDKADYPLKEEVIRSLACTLDLDAEELIYLAGRIPQSEEEFIKRHYDKIPTLFRRMQENPDFAEKVFYEAAQSSDENLNPRK